MPVVTVENLKKVYGKQFMLDGLSFQVPAGAFCAVIGDDVSGKRALLETLAGLSPAGSGSIIRPPRFQYVPGGVAAYENVTAEALFEHTMRLFQIGDAAECNRLCEQFQVDTHQKLLNMTYMENRCVALINALISNPALLLLDEPYNYLPDHVYEQFLDIIGHKCRNGMTVLAACECFEDVRSHASQYLFLKEGDLIFDGSLEAGFCPWKMVTVYQDEPMIVKGLDLEWIIQEKDRRCFLFKESPKELLRLLVRIGCPDFLVEELTFEEQLFENYERWKKTCFSGN